MAAVHLNEATFHHLLQGEKPVLVEFWAPWCSHCRDLEADFDRIAEEYGQQLSIGKLNIDDHPQLVQQYFIDYVPTLMLFSDGSVVDYVISPGSHEAIVRFIEDLL